MLKQFEKQQLVSEMYGGEVYDYYPLGKHIVMAPGVCGGRPTFKYTRIEVRVILGWLRLGRSIDDIVTSYNREHLTPVAIQEAIELAENAFNASVVDLLPLAA